MFSSQRLITPRLPPSSNLLYLFNSCFDSEKDIHSSNHQRNENQFLSGEFLFHHYISLPPPPPPPVVVEDVTTLKQDFVRQQPFSEVSGIHYREDHYDLLDNRYKKKLGTSKKDGHSKIYTARGPMDRRVRLSVDIARKFFCLQDLLGFDKPSKTVDWLLTNSTTAIKDLVEETNHCSSSIVTDQSDVKFLETIIGGSDEDGGQKEKSIPKCVDGKKKKMSRTFQEKLARDQLRAEARARARERTKEKMRVKNLDDELRTSIADSRESRSWGQVELGSDYNDIGWECIMDQETLNQQQDSSFQQANHAINDSDLEKMFEI